MPAWLAFSVTRLLEEHFDRLISYEFTATMEDVLDEIAKCDVVCANCHRRRTALRGGFARAAVAQW